MKKLVEYFDSLEAKASDWLSPMLVKELRQGMRSKAFVASFLLIQALMFCSVLISLVNRTESGVPGDVEGSFFWFMIAVPLIFIMPVRGYNTLASEIRGRTMELVFLTRLTSWRIVTGKWAALFAQTLLIACAVLPYIVVRYYLGNVDLFGDVQTLAVMLGVSGLLTAVTVGLSAYGAKMVKSLHALGFILVFSLVIPSLSLLTRSRRPVSLGYDVEFYLSLLIFGTLYLLIMLEVGAARIAPPAENHAFRKRFIGLLICAAMIAFAGFKIAEPVAILSMIPIGLICMGALCEEIRLIPTVYTRFAKRGFLGRLVGKLFYPGWPSGLLYTLLATAVCFWVVVLYGDWKVDVGLPFVSLLGAIIWPIALAKLFLPNRPVNAVFYVVCQSIVCILTPVMVALDTLFKTNLKMALSVFPTSVFFMCLGGLTKNEETFYLTVTIIVAVVCFVLLFWRSLASWREIRRLEQQAVQLEHDEHSSGAV